MAACLRAIAPVRSAAPSGAAWPLRTGVLWDRQPGGGRRSKTSHVGHATRATHDLLRLWKFVLHGRGCGGYPAGLPYTGGAGILSLFPRPLFIALTIAPALPIGAGVCTIPACLSSAQTSVAAGPMVEGMSR